MRNMSQTVLPLIGIFVAILAAILTCCIKLKRYQRSIQEVRSQAVNNSALAPTHPVSASHLIPATFGQTSIAVVQERPPGVPPYPSSAGNPDVAPSYYISMNTSVYPDEPPPSYEDYLKSQTTDLSSPR